MTDDQEFIEQVAEAICDASHAGRVFPWATLTERERAGWHTMAEAAVAVMVERIGPPW